MKEYKCVECQYTFEFPVRPNFCPNCGKPKVRLAPKGSEKRQTGRPRKKPNYDKDEKIQEQLDIAVALFSEPLDDRMERSADAPSIASVAEEMGTTPIRVKKMLITAGYYSTAISRKVQELHNSGRSIQEIIDATGLKSSSVYCYLPYTKGIYNLADPTLCAEQCRLFVKRKRLCADMKKHINAADSEQYLWETIEAFENYLFQTAEGHPLRYKLEGKNLFFSKQDKTISQEAVLEAFHRVKDIQVKGGFVSRPEEFGEIADCDLSAASYLYSIFLRIGVCEKALKPNE